MASLDTIQAVVQSAAQAISNLAQTWLQVNGLTNTASVSAAANIKNTSGRVVNVSVIVAGSTAGTIYDNSGTATTYPVCSIPNSVGVFTINMPVQYGIYVVPGTGQTVTVSYS